ncbi:MULTISPECIES: hypothetical protein [Streptomyces]|jgi:hypothetical protein|uniref:hypothetical protein n=1 Tax=Streptomyces TaxID=1883 RepID=UPI0004C0143D|nr:MULTISPECIES: hypothetical protein [Streptomyces]WSQ21784.1 hypothetical protein OG237_32315 [Streptomyces zaomyceticus]
MQPVLRITGLAAGALLLAGGAFLFGRSTAPASGSVNADCQDPKQALSRAIDDAKTAVDDSVAQEHGQRAVTVILQNPSCFDADTRATAQEIRDSQGQDPITRFLQQP